MSCALVSGTFDPITLGHLDVISRAASVFDKVLVAVMNNYEKTPLFPIRVREELARLATAEFPNVEVVVEEGSMLAFFPKSGADVVVRGIRNETDFAYECNMAEYLREREPTLETVFLAADPALAGISATAVREVLSRGEVPVAYLPKAVADRILSDPALRVVSE